MRMIVPEGLQGIASKIYREMKKSNLLNTNTNRKFFDLPEIEAKILLQSAKAAYELIFYYHEIELAKQSEALKVAKEALRDLLILCNEYGCSSNAVDKARKSTAKQALATIEEMEKL